MEKKFEEEDKKIIKNNENYKNNPLFIENNEKLKIIGANNNFNNNINTENCMTNNDIKQDKVNNDTINNNNNYNYNNKEKDKDKEKIFMEKITYQLNELKNEKNEKKKLSNRNKINNNSPNNVDSVI